jgi:hypothetical protein
MEEHWALSVVRRLSQVEPLGPPGLRDDIARLCEIVQALPSYEFRLPALAKLADALWECADLDSAAELMADVGSVCGFDYANIFLLRQGRAIAFEKRVCTSFPQEWLRAYDAKRYQFVDPVVARALEGGESFLFADLPVRAPIVESFWRDAVAHGIGREGCCFMFDLDLGVEIGMSFNSNGTREAAAAAFEANRSDLSVLGQVACRAFMEIAGVFQVHGTQLSVDDLRFLKSLINSSDPAGASALLQDTETQARQHSICKRLGVGTIFQALAVVARERWFDDLPFDGTEVAKPYPGELEPNAPEG